MRTLNPFTSDKDSFLRQLNELLAKEHIHSLRRDLTEQFATLHVVGVPRSGTTILMQLLASSLHISYPSNLSAVFWEAPLYGVALAEMLFDGAFHSSFNSRYGRTFEPQEPHEFGRFWLKLLNYDSLEEVPGHKIDRELVRDTLINMAEAAGKPFAFKSFLPVWHLREIAELCQKCIVIHVKRDKFENAFSLLTARKNYVKNENHWVGLKPAACKKYQNESLFVQVASQVVEVERFIEKEKLEIPNERIISTSLTEVLENPEKFISTVSEKVNGVQGFELPISTVIPSIPRQAKRVLPSSFEVESLQTAFQLVESCTKN